MQDLPTEQYWSDCEKRLQEELAAQSGPLCYISTLQSVMRFLECIIKECGPTVREIPYFERYMMSICITSKLVFGTAIVSNLDIPHFLCESYSIKQHQRQF